MTHRWWREDPKDDSNGEKGVSVITGEKYAKLRNVYHKRGPDRMEEVYPVTLSRRS